MSKVVTSVDEASPFGGTPAKSSAGLREATFTARGPVVALGWVALAGAIILSITWGSVSVPLVTIFQILLGKVPLVERVMDAAAFWPASYEAIILQIRLPRVILGALTGASLAIAGASYQGLFRNPLADPYLIGVSSGAALGAVLAIVISLPPLFYSLGGVQVSAFGGALLTVAVVYALARVGKTTPVATLLLAGVALGAFASSVTTFLMYVHGDKLGVIFSWLLGGFVLGSWSQILLILPYCLVGMILIRIYGRPLNAMQLDEEQAAQLGINVERLKLIVISAATLVTAAAVSVSGLIGFVGLIVPHAVRLLWGPDYRLLLPMSAIGGAIFLVLADSLARTAMAPTEIPVGVVTALTGAPFFMFLLRQRKRAVF